jgi:DNA-binding GntR family transcriptional regulator
LSTIFGGHLTVSAEQTLTEIARTSFADSAYRQIWELIVSGRFGGGDQLVETRLAQQLGTSRGPVREALKRLREDGLVVEELHRGVFVKAFSVDDIVDLYNVRIGLETVAIRLATRHRCSTASLRADIGEMAEAAEQGDLPLLSSRELAFHQTLCELSENEYVGALFRSISARMRVALELDSAEYDARLELAGDHERLVEAMEAGDEEEAVLRLHRHIVQGLPEGLYRLADRVAAEAALARLLRPRAKQTGDDREQSSRAPSVEQRRGADHVGN